MRWPLKLRVRCLLAVGILAVLVTLLSPFTSAPRLLDPRPPTPLQLPLQGVSEDETKEPLEAPKKSLAEKRVEEEIEEIEVKQKELEVKQKELEVKKQELEVSEEIFIQNPPPKEWVEVKKTNPKVKTGRLPGKDKQKQSALKKDFTASLAVVGHSPKDLQRRALTFPKDSPMRVFLKEQERRVAHIDATCRSFTPNLADVVAGSRGPPAGLLSIKHIIYDRLNQLTFCPVYKAASTSWTVTMLQLGGLWTAKTKKLPLQKLVHMFYPKMTGLAAATVTTNTTHFMVVRHPLDRLLSCYLDKFQNASKDFYYHLYSEKIIQRYRHSLAGLPSHQVQTYKEEVRGAMKEAARSSGGGGGGGGVPNIHLPANPFANPLGPTFPEFVEHLINTNYDDEHWRPYTSHCVPCTLSYEFVLRFESLKEENRCFLEYLNRTGEVAPRWDNPNPSGDTKKLSCDYYSQLSLHQIDGLVKKYRRDLMLYEYDVEDHRKCAKDYAELNATITTVSITKHAQSKYNIT